MIIDLCKPLALPEVFTNRLHQIKKLCLTEDFSESLVEHHTVTALVRDIDQYCTNNKITGVHYTRSEPENIREKGLLVRNGNDIRANFLLEYGHLFTQDETRVIKSRWSECFHEAGDPSRDNRIFFNFTDVELGRAGSKYLLGLFGGEQVSFCFEIDDPIGQKLAKIGQPIVVRCSLHPSHLTMYTKNPWGKILVSSFHALINPNAYRIDFDGFQTVPVSPLNVIDLRIM